MSPATTVTDLPLATDEEWEDLTGQPPGPGTEARLATASALVRQWCGWQISYREGDVVTVDYRGDDRLLLPSLHIVAVSEVTRLTAVLVPELYQWWRGGWIELQRGLGGDCPRPRLFTVTMDHGYDPVPPPIANATLAIAQQLLANPTGATSVRVGDVSVSYGSTLGAGRGGSGTGLTAESLLAPYVLPWRP